MLAREVQDAPGRSGPTPPAHQDLGGAPDDVGVGDEHAVARDEEPAPQRERLIVIVDGDERHDGRQVLTGDPRGHRFLGAGGIVRGGKGGGQRERCGENGCDLHGSSLSRHRLI